MEIYASRISQLKVEVCSGVLLMIEDGNRDG
jgi:hypothetical protein